MSKRLVGKLCVVVALSSVTTGAVVSAGMTTPAGAAVHKKHPHKKASAASKKLKKLASGVASEKTATFEVVYSVSSSGKTESVTFAQSPPKYLVKVASGTVLYTGTETLFCTSNACISETTGTNPVSSLEELFSPTTARAFFNHAEVEVAAKAKGYSVSFSSGTYGGLSSECATVSGHGQTGTYCVAKNGLLTYGKSSGGSITLTSYTSSVAPATFEPPSGATIVTVPTT